MSKIIRTLVLALGLVACAPPPSEPSAELEHAAAALSPEELDAAASQLIDQEAQESALDKSGGPLSLCGYPPFCPPGTQPIYQGCDARCYVLYGYDCLWGYNRVDCLAVPPQASITATPQTVTVVPGRLGTTRICWNTQALNYPVWIRVRVDGGAGQLFTKESDSGQACENAGWIQAGHSYEFAIHDDNDDASPVYSSVTVVGRAGSAPPPPPPGACAPGGSGSCPSGQGCQCGETFCTPINRPCP